jgi:PAS domain S-box-containing protein
VTLVEDIPGARKLYTQYQQEICERTDRMFVGLLLVQWLAQILTAIWATPGIWDGSFDSLPPLVWKAFLLGGGMVALPVYVAYRYPGTKLTRQEIAIGQALTSCLLVHLAGGRIEMHFAVFASLAFLSMYRDAGVLILASAILVIDHVLGCFLWPRSVYGVPEVTAWAWLEHSTWIVVEDLLLILAIRKSQQDLMNTARKQATLDASRVALEKEVAERQRTERLLALQYVITRLLAGSSSVAEASPVLLRIIAESQGWQVGELWEVDEAEQRLRVVDLWHTPNFAAPAYLEARRGMTLGPEVGLPGRVWQRHVPLWIVDMAQEPSFPLAAFKAQANLHGAFAVPLRNGAKVNGVMAFFSHEVREPNDDHLSMISALGSQIGQFIERKRIEQGLRDSEERYRSVIAALDEGIILVDVQGRLLASNASAERILGASAGDMLSKSCLDLFPGTIREDESPFPGETLPFMQSLETAEAHTNVVVGLRRSDGARAWISLNSQPLVRFGESAPYAAMASFTDITARKQAEESLLAAHADLESRVEKRTSQLLETNQKLQSEVEERERVQRELRNAKDIADSANRAKSAFLANMSHELRTPLNAVIGFSELLEQEIFGTLTDKQRAYVGNVLISGRHLLQLVNDILDISKVEAGRMDLACELTPIGGIIDVVKGVIQAVANKKGINLEVSAPATLPELYLDPGRVKQVLYNLLSNAIKFTPRGGSVRLTTCFDEQQVTVMVTDTGVGIAAENLPRLFREFEQIPLAGGVRPEGTGLGLALTKRLVELHGGEVHVVSEVGKGSTFSVKLPLRQPGSPGPSLRPDNDGERPTDLGGGI